MVEVLCSILQLTISHLEQHLSTFPLTSNVTNTQMCGLFPSDQWILCCSLFALQVKAAELRVWMGRY